MFLKKSTIVLLVFLSSMTTAAVNETPFHKTQNFDKDIKILKRTIQRKPDDYISIKRLAKIYFVAEDFKTAQKYCHMHLAGKKDKEIAYMEIISLACQNQYMVASRKIDSFMKTYNLGSDEKKLLHKKMKIFMKARRTKPLPQNVERLFRHGNKLIGMDDKNNRIYLYDSISQKLNSYSYVNGKMKRIKTIHDVCKGFAAADLLYLGFSTGGRKMLATIRKGNTGSRILLRKYDVARRRWSPWKTVKEMNPGNANCFGNFSSDSRTVFFSSDTENDNGQDIYFTTMMDTDNWTKPRKVKGVNTPFDEYSMFLHSDGENLTFCTNGRNGLGGHDIYSAILKKEGDGYSVHGIQNVSTINTFRNESFPLLIDSHSGIGFFHFTIAGKNHIYTINTIPVKAKPVIFLDAYIYDSKSRKGIKDAEIKIMKIGKKENRGGIIKASDSDGFIGTTIIEKSRYLISISAEGYLYYKKYISFSDRNFVRKNFYIKRGMVKRGFSFKAENIYFDTGSAKIRIGSEAELHNIYNFMKKNPRVTIAISGFTDSVGTFKKNMRLSRNRAASIANYLVKRGIRGKRLKIRGFGSLKNVAPNLTEKGRQMNRRVEVEVTGSK